MSIQLRGADHRYKNLLALDQVSLHVRRGDCYGFIGHNGAGKTTALRIVLGLLTPKGGHVEIDGHDGTHNPPVRALVGGMIEHPGFHENRSGPRNLVMLAGLQGIPARERKAEVARVLDLVGLTSAGEKRVGQYSQGMRQRLGLAQALLGSPRYLVLDEPTNGLDPQGIHELRMLLQTLAQETGTTILLSSHLLAEVADLCTRIGVLHEGKLLAEVPTDELLDSAHAVHHLKTDDDAAAAETLRGLAVATTESTDGGLRMTLTDSSLAASDVVRELVGAGHSVQAFAPVEVSLEEIYLEFARGERAAQTAVLPPPETRAEDAKLPGPRNGLVATSRIVAYQFRRVARPGPIFGLLVPALLAPLVVYQRLLGAEQNAEAVAGGGTVSTTDVTAFEALGRALQTMLPLLALLVAGLASQSIAGELRGGTLRNILIRPFRRLEVVVGKLWVLSTIAVLAYLLLLGSAALAAGIAFDYGDLVEILATGKTYPHLKAEEVWPELWPAIASPLVPLLAMTALGFLCGTITRSASGALAVTLGVITALELFRGFAKNWGFEFLLPGPYLPSPLAANASHIDYLVLVAGGVSTEPWALEWVVPAIWLLAGAALAWAALRRKYVS